MLLMSGVTASLTPWYNFRQFDINGDSVVSRTSWLNDIVLEKHLVNERLNFVS